jgi:phosphoserine phosphatase RsbU/P
VSALLAMRLPPPAGGLASADPRVWLTVPVFLLTCSILIGAVAVSRRAKRQAEASSRRQREILERIRAGLGVLGRDWTILYANPEAGRILGVRREDLIGRRLRDALPIQDTSFAHLKRAMEERVPVEYDSRDPVRGTCFSTRAFPTDEGIAVFFLDVTDQKRAEEDRERARELFLGTLGHDLGTPLSTILASARILEKRTADEAAVGALNRIRSSAKRMGRMIEQLLDFTRARLGPGIPIRPVAGNLRAICSSVLEEIEAQYPKRVRLDAAGDFAGEWDADRLGQVVSNLVVNAIHHGMADEPVSVRLAAVDGNVRLEVTSRGTIDPAAVPSLYEPFRRSERSRSEHPRGLGLGLFIVREIVRSHGGSIDVVATEGATTFAVTLPGRAAHPI